ncbi:hypothetical protein GCM10023333_15110 [Ferrimonas pelagia]|uniref:LysR substrate-binding domain-containing protein n=1 Tax=Ferrimonas pelagia TaxID=1177826 RepID=A0ABP9EKY3_9GAMM
MHDLTQYPVALHDFSRLNGSGNSLIERVLKQHNLQLNLRARVADCQALYASLLSGNTIAYTSTLALPDDLSDYVLLAAPKPLTQVQTQYCLYIASQRYGSQETSYISDLIYTCFQQLYDQQTRPEIAQVLTTQNNLLKA